MEIPGASNELQMDMLTKLRASSSKGDLMHMASVAQGDSEEGLKLASREFTGMFLGQMMKEMRSTVELGELGHGGEAENTFQGMLDEEWARNVAYTGDIEGGGGGFVGVVYDSMQRRSTANAYENFLQSKEEPTGSESNQE